MAVHFIHRISDVTTLLGTNPHKSRVIKKHNVARTRTQVHLTHKSVCFPVSHTASSKSHPLFQKDRI